VTPVPAPPAQPATAKGDQTRQRILASALQLFEERGYEGTTMRAIAAAADVSLGNAYYYFGSKEHLIQAFYDRLQTLHRESATIRMQSSRSLEGRLAAVISAWAEVSEPYHEFAGVFFRVAAEPSSPMSPFSEQSAPAREAAIGLYRDALAGADATIPAELGDRLPELLWLAHMGLVLFWVHDRSPGQQHTRALAERAVPLLARLIRVARLRPLRPAVRQVIDLMDAVRSPSVPAPPAG
jgi:AcrR family transcriptional regulator